MAFYFPQNCNDLPHAIHDGAASSQMIADTRATALTAKLSSDEKTGTGESRANACFLTAESTVPD